MNRDAGNVLRCNVLPLFLTLCIIWARPVLIPARRGPRSRGVADVGRGAVLQQASHAGWREALGSPVLVQVETPNSPACEEASWLFPFPYPSSRAAQPPSINLPPRSASCGPQGAGSVTHTSSTHARHHIPTTSWPGLFRASRSCEAQRFTQSGSPARGR
jgi:hypothetical protein